MNSTDDLWVPIALSIFAVATCALFGWIAGWVARGPGRWPARMLVPYVLIAALWPINAQDLAVVLLAELYVVLAGFVLIADISRLKARFTRSAAQPNPPPAWQFGLSDIVALCLYAAVTFAALRQAMTADSSPWRFDGDLPARLAHLGRLVALGALIGGVALAAWHVALIRTHKFRGLTFLAYAILIALAAQSDFVIRLYWDHQPDTARAGPVALRLVPLFALVALSGLWYTGLRRGSIGPWRRRAGYALLAVLILLPATTLAALYRRVPMPPVDPALVERFRHLDEFVMQLEIPERDNLESVDVARRYVANNRETLDASLALLSQRAMRDLKIAPPFLTPLTADITRPGNISLLAGLLTAAAIVAWNDDRPAQCAEACLAAIRLGHAYRDGGILWDSVNEATTSTGAHLVLGAAIPDFPPDVARRTITALRDIELAREPLAALAQRQRAWDDRYEHWSSRLCKQVERLRDGPDATVDQYFELGDRLSLAHLRLVQADLAVRAFAAERGSPPNSLDELVPDYLSAVPVDPFTQKPLIYHVLVDGTWQVYSCGPDGANDGGNMHPAHHVNGDIFIPRNMVHRE